MPRVDPVSLMLMLPLVGAAAAFLLTFRAPSSWAGGTVAGTLLSATLVAAFAAVRVSREGALFLVVGGWQESVGIHLQLDGIAAVLLLTLFLVSLLVLLYAMGEGGYGALFYATYAVAVAGMAGVLLSADLFNLFVFFEVLSLAATILIAYKRRLPGLYAAYRYLLVTALSVVLYLTGLFLLYRASGELALRALFARFSAGSTGLGLAAGVTITPSKIAGVLLFTGVAIRVALVPFHAWLPDAHSQAPHPVSAFLSGLVIKAAFLALWRMVTLFSGQPAMMDLLLLAGVLSALVGVLLAMAQHDPKRLLAFHSISQMGYIAAAAGGGALAGALYHAVGHALFKSLLFLVVGYYIGRTGSRDLYHLGTGNGTSSPRRELIPPALLLVGAAAIAGLPPFTGFVSKSLIGAALKGSPAYSVLRVVSVCTAASFIKLSRLLIPISLTTTASLDTDGEATEQQTGELTTPTWNSRLLLLTAMSALSLPILLLGLFPAAVIDWIGSLGVTSREALSGTQLYTLEGIGESGLILLLGALLSWVLLSGFGRKSSRFISKLRLGLDGSLGVMALGVVLAALFLHL